MRKKYSTDLTDEQWAVIAPLFKGMRRCTVFIAVQGLVEYAIIDSQSVDTAYKSEQVGFDGGKKTRDINATS